MNWGAVLFSCVLAPRVCGPAGKNGGVPIGTPPFLGESLQFFLRGSPFFCARRGGVRCAVRSDAQFLAHRVKEVSKRLAHRGGWRVEAAGG